MLALLMASSAYTFRCCSVIPKSQTQTQIQILHFTPIPKPTNLHFRPRSSFRSAPMAYEKELAAAKKATSLASRLCQKVQKVILQSDVQSKSDKSPVTVADYGSQALVSFVLGKELTTESLSMVAEEDSGDLRMEAGQEDLKRITELVNATLAEEGTYNISLSKEDVLAAIDKGKSEGGPHGRHWVLDPIDGTKGFLRGEQYAIALALLDEDSGDLRMEAGQEDLKRITELVNATLAEEGTYNISLSKEDVLAAIDKGKSEGGPHGRHWVLDPIDGTKGFLRGEQYAIALALLDEGELSLGDLRMEAGQEDLKRITELVNATLAEEGTYNISLSKEDVLAAIDKGKSEGGPHGRHWVLDPIDGTKGFLRGEQYAIALALLDEGELSLGVLACPNLPLAPLADLDKQMPSTEVGCILSAKAGDGTYMESLCGSSSEKVSVSSIKNPVDASFFESVEAAHTRRDLSSSIAEKLGVQAPAVRIDSQAKYAALAKGDGAIYLRFPHKGYREKIWDHAAGAIVITEAGGVVSDASGNPLDFSKGRYLDVDTGIIATNQKLMPLLLNAVQEAIKERS